MKKRIEKNRLRKIVDPVIVGNKKAMRHHFLGKNEEYLQALGRLMSNWR